MSARKPRIDKKGPSPLEQLRQLVRANPAEGEFLETQAAALSALELIAQIEARHGIYGLAEPRLSEFWAWLDEQREIRAANESVQNIRDIFQEVMPGAGPGATHDFLVKYLTSQGFAKKDTKTLRFVTVEERKRVELAQNRLKLEVITCEMFLRWFKDAQAREIAESNLSNADKITRLREKYFEDIDALEKSGTVVLPE